MVAFVECTFGEARQQEMETNHGTPPVPPVEVVLYGDDEGDESVTVWLTPTSHQALRAATERHPDLAAAKDGNSVANLLIRLAYLDHVARETTGFSELSTDDSDEADDWAQWSGWEWLKNRWQGRRGRKEQNVLVTLRVRQATFGYVEGLATELDTTLTQAINRMLQMGNALDAHLQVIQRWMPMKFD